MRIDDDRPAFVEGGEFRRPLLGDGPDRLGEDRLERLRDQVAVDGGLPGPLADLLRPFVGASHGVDRPTGLGEELMRGVELPRLERLQPLRPAPLGDLGEPLPARSPGAEGDRADDQEPHAQEQESMPPSPGPVAPRVARQTRDGRPPRDDGGTTSPILLPRSGRSAALRGGRRGDGPPTTTLDPPSTRDGFRPGRGRRTSRGRRGLRGGAFRPRSCILGIARDIDPLDLAGRPGIPNVLHLRGIGQGDRHVFAAKVVVEAATIVGGGAHAGAGMGRRGGGDGQGTARQDKNPRAARRTAHAPDSFGAHPPQGVSLGADDVVGLGRGRGSRGPIPAGGSAARSRRFSKAHLTVPRGRPDSSQGIGRIAEIGGCHLSGTMDLIPLWGGACRRSTGGRGAAEDGHDRAARRRRSGASGGPRGGR